MKTNLLGHVGLRRVLTYNAIFSGLSGLFLMLGAQPLGRLMGITDPLSLAIVGVNLVLFALFLVWLIRQPTVPRVLAWAVVGSDVLWVVASAFGLMLVPHTLTGTGVFLIADVAGIVAGFAAAQIYCLIRRPVAARETS